MLKTLNLSATKVVELSADDAKGTPEATRFTIGVLDGRLIGILRDRSMDVKINTNDPNGEPETMLRMNEMLYAAAQYGVRGVENLRDHNGDDIDYATVKRNIGGKSYPVLSDRVLDILPADAIMELGQAVLSMSDLSEDDAKKSAG